MKLALGTVQFGQSYGVADDGGPPREADIAAILQACRGTGIDIVDTAPLYGRCEAILGAVPGGLSAFRVITKTGHFSDEADIADPARGVRATLLSSLRDLRSPRVAGLLVHNPRDALATWGDALIDAMQRVRDDGLVEKIGLSVYEPSDLAAFARLDDIDLVQLPLNLFDQRMVRSGWVARLKDRGIEVHARSAFLQGLLCMDPARVPAGLAPAVPLLQRFHAARDGAALSAPAACLAFLAAVAEVDAVVVGVKSLAQFDEVVRASAVRWETDFSAFAIDDPAIVDPRRWAA